MIGWGVDLESSSSLRAALLLSVGLGGCTPQAPVKPVEAEQRVTTKEPTKTEPTKTEPTRTEPAPGSVASPTPKPPGRVVAADGAVHRAGPETCSAIHPLPSCTFKGERLECTSDAQCTAGPHGKCAQESMPTWEFCACVYPCTNDGECPDGKVCTCESADQFGRCVPANCKTDGDCASGRCSLAPGGRGCGTPRFACRTDQDTCSSDADCKKDWGCDANGGRWTCQPQVSCTF
jgi:hypothetical protein